MGRWEGGQVPSELGEITGFDSRGGPAFHSAGLVTPWGVSLLVHFLSTRFEFSMISSSPPLKKSGYFKEEK